MSEPASDTTANDTATNDTTVSATPDAWQGYQAAARRLDSVRREGASALAEQQAVAQAARTELKYVRERLALQQREWPAAGVAPQELIPAPPAVPADGTGVPADGTLGVPLDSPERVLDTLRRTRSIVDEADALVLGRPAPASGLAGLPPNLRNLFVYAPFAFLAVAIQYVLSTSENGFFLLIGLALPAVAFVLGFLTIGLIFPPAEGTKVDRTPVLGAGVCLASVVMLCAGYGILAWQT